VKPNINVIIICVTVLIATAGTYLSVASFNATLLTASNTIAENLTPRLQPREFTVTVDGAMSVGNRKGGSFDVGMTMGKSN
jgi:hypothetical protein